MLLCWAAVKEQRGNCVYETHFGRGQAWVGERKLLQPQFFQPNKDFYPHRCCLSLFLIYLFSLFFQHPNPRPQGDLDSLPSITCTAKCPYQVSKINIAWMEASLNGVIVELYLNYFNHVEPWLALHCERLEAKPLGTVPPPRCSLQWTEVGVVGE